jgi:hypothetical protein
MSTGTICPAERRTQIDTDTGRTVTSWAVSDKAHNIGLYYHQNPFDAERNLVYFVSDRSDSWQLWRADMNDGRLTQVTEFEGLGRLRLGSQSNYHGANYWVHVSRRSGMICVGGDSRIAIVDPDTLHCRVIWDGRITEEDHTSRFVSQSYVYPSCDEQWVYSYGVWASRNELMAAEALSKAAFVALKAEGRRVQAQYTRGLHGMTESPLEQVIFRIEVATGRIEELWRGHWWIQHVTASPTDPDLITFLWAAFLRPKPKYFLMRAGESPTMLLRDELNSVLFHDFWHPDGTRWFSHCCENLEPEPEVYTPIPGKMQFLVREVDIANVIVTGEVQQRDWIESAGVDHVHLHLNIAPDGSFLVGDGQPDCPWICRLDWQEDGTITATPLCRSGYPDGRFGGMESNPNVHISPDGDHCFFTTWHNGRAQVASVNTNV